MKRPKTSFVGFGPFHVVGAVGFEPTYRPGGVNAPEKLLPVP
jgi:hypothetical protein